jgi:hypothetical protein
MTSPMKEFFMKELDTLHLKTGLRQLENLMAKPDWQQDIDLLVDLMVQACNYPPFNLIGVDVKQRVIQQAIIEDKDFIGLNAKFVVRSLNTWWNHNKDRYYEKHLVQQEQVPEHEPLRGEAMQKMLDTWKKDLGLAENNFKVPKLSPEEIKAEGQERDDSLESELNKLAPRMDYKLPDPLWLEVNGKIKKVCGSLYGKKSLSEISKLRNYEVEDKQTRFTFTILCKSQEKAEEIYIEAITT